MTLVASSLAAASTALALGPSPGQARLRRLMNIPMARSTPSTRRHDGRAAEARSRSPAGRTSGLGILSGRRGRTASAVLAAVSAGWLLGGSLGLVVAPMLGTAAWFAIGRLEPVEAARVRQQTAQSLPLAAELLAAALAAGSPPVMAAEAVALALGGPLGAALRAAAAAARLGVEPASAWMGIASDPALRPLARALAGAVTRGASPTAVLERVAYDARDALRWAAEARARSLGAKAAAPLGLCFLPAFVLVGIVPVVVAAGPVLP
jgi:Flp pilus assembly protein TadB